MRVLVTGGAGRLGRSVVGGLAGSGHEVISADRTASTGSLATPSVRQVAIELTDERAIDELFARERPEAVVHLAAIAVPFSAPEREILVTNTTLAWTVLDAAVRHGVTRVLAASSPTVIGYGAPTGWAPQYLPIDERHPLAPWNAYSLSKRVIEDAVATVLASTGDRMRLGVFRPCYVISPEEWAGAPTQQGHTVEQRLADPELAAVSLFNYVDARDAADFVDAWLSADDSPNGAVYFVGADDALAVEPLATLLPRSLPASRDAARGLTGSAPAFSNSAAATALGWHPRRSWRSELPADVLARLGAEARLDDGVHPQTPERTT